jgi:hypothetical protein
VISSPNASNGREESATGASQCMPSAGCHTRCILRAQLSLCSRVCQHLQPVMGPTLLAVILPAWTHCNLLLPRDGLLAICPLLLCFGSSHYRLACLLLLFMPCGLLIPGSCPFGICLVLFHLFVYVSAGKIAIVCI